jgi:MYXO-CTERM domain-containing protein
MAAVFAALLLAFAQNDKTQANSYDDAWESAWVTHCRTIYSTSGKTAGFVLQVGDSITHANPYSQWPRSGSGKTAEDTSILTWCMSSSWNSGSNTDLTNKNGWYLAAADTSGQRGMTASGGLDTGEFLSGNGNGGNAMPASPGSVVADGVNYVGNLNVAAVVAAFGDAQFAVLMLGTNDANGAMSTSTYSTNLASIVSALEGQNIVVVVSTVPPSTQFDVTPYNAAIRSYAQTHGLPLIDYYAEILARQPVNWSTTLISSDGIHPSTVNSAADPYTPGGDPTTWTTGDNCLNDGYLLRSWLTVQKLKEVKLYVADGVNPPSSGGGGGGGTPPPTSTGGSGNGSPDHSRCGCGAAPAPSPVWLWLAAGLALLALRRR